MMALLIGASLIAIFTTLGIVLSLLFESLRFFQIVPISDFLFGLTWSPQMAIRADQAGSSGRVRLHPALLGHDPDRRDHRNDRRHSAWPDERDLSDPICGARGRSVVKPLLEILAGVPTVVYGYFAALTVAPGAREVGITLGIEFGEQRKRPRRRSRHGHHDHSVRQLDGRRFPSLQSRRR